MFLSHLEIVDLRNIEKADLALARGLNLFVGRNAQGKTSVLEGVGLLSRGRSFRSEDARAAVRRGRAGLIARAAVSRAGRETGLEVRIDEGGARLPRGRAPDDAPRVSGPAGGGRSTPPSACGSCAAPCATGGSSSTAGRAALWPSYQKLHREFERVLAQRNAALAARSRDLPAWNERFALVGGALRYRRADYARRLTAGLERGFRPEAEAYAVTTRRRSPRTKPTAQADLRRAMDEGRARRARSGPQPRGPPPRYRVACS